VSCKNPCLMEVWQADVDQWWGGVVLCWM